MRKLHIRGVSRLISGLFAVQLFAAGLCMMVPATHAMPPTSSHTASHSMDMSADHCAPPVADALDAGTNQSACSHCNQPDELLQNVQSPVHGDMLFIAYIGHSLNDISVFQPALRLTSRVPTGPPKSSSLLYNTTQRIRI
ncbi:hypothetical protein [Mariprofundus aestuarium]|nr:hypothetical protein [Mariprofundus aestuarium]